MIKKQAVKIMLVLLLANFVLELYSQDTIRNTSETSFDFVDSKYKNREDAFRISLYSNAEEITFWDKRYKNEHFGYGVLANYEFKFAKSHSLNTGVKAYLTNDEYEYLSIFTSYRFYHNLNSRVRLGKTGENFSANYFFIEPSVSIERSPYRLQDSRWDFTKGEWELWYEKSVRNMGTVRVGYGVQRNVFKNFNFDGNIGFNIREKKFSESDNSYINPFIARTEYYFVVQISLGYIIR